MRVERFTGTARKLWDEFVQASSTGTFLFLRDYMDYHQDRFEDCSLMVFGTTGEPLALLPANRRGDVLESHGGLTYGGLVAGALTTPQTLAVFDALLEDLRNRSFSGLRYRAMPHVYHRVPAQADLFALTRHGARIVHRTALSILDTRNPGPTQSRRVRGARRARAAGLVCRETGALKAYWSLLTDALRETYGAQPVHSLEEIDRLRRRFPHNIRLFGCFRGITLVAGVLVYESATVARAQYIAASQAGKELAALDLVFDVLLHEIFPDKPYFDFGTSEASDRHHLNPGVIEFKESLGARTVIQDTYELSLL